MRDLIAILVLIFIGFIYFGFIGDFPIDDSLFNNDKTTISEEEESSDRYFKKIKEGEVLISRVVDGDTVIVINHEGKEERVRLLLIDTPESVHPNKPPEKYGKEASDYAKEYLKQGMRVALERGNPEKDKYDRTLGYIFVDGVNFNQLMIEKGYARVAYVYEPNTKYLDEFIEAEKRAKEKKLNIWSIDGYVTENGFDMSVVE